MNLKRLISLGLFFLLSLSLTACQTTHSSGNISSKEQVNNLQIVSLGHATRIIVPNTIIFRQHSAEINPQGQQILSRIVSRLQNVKQNITVAVYTNNLFSSTAALQLTKQRAHSLVGYLWAHGIAIHWLHPLGMGNTHAITNNHNPTERYINNRTEIRFG